MNTWYEKVLSPAIEEQVRSSDIDRSGSQILIIDDNQDVLHTTKSIITAYGYKCITAESGDIGLKILKESHVDIVLLDLAMPGTDGYEVLMQIQQAKIDVEVIVVSGKSTFENAVEVFRNGAYDFLNKPYEAFALINTLDGALYKRKLKLQVNKVNRQLEESSKRFRFLVNNSPDIIYLLDQHGYIRYVNERSKEVLGFEPNDLIGLHFSEWTHEDEALMTDKLLQNQRINSSEVYNYELRLKCLNGEFESKPFETKSVIIDLNDVSQEFETQSKQPTLGLFSVARDISERKKAQEMIHFQAYHDLLTGLPNRELFLDRMHLSISHSIRNKNKLAVMFLDMDGFKFINDSLGHVIGDELLKQVAKRLKQTLRETDTVSRIGGDEFSILLPDLHNRDEAGVIAEKILAAFNQPIILEKHEVTIGFSIGISMYPDDATCTDQLIKNADMSMYYIKGRGKNGYEFFSDHMQSIYHHHHTIEQDIRRALEKKQFESFYQPQYDITDCKIVGLEALIRWNHPNKGLVTPDNFIPVAEEIGLISEVGRFMLQVGCRQLKKWIDDGVGPVKLSINVSTYQLAESDFDSNLYSLIREYDISPNLLILEITESALIQEMDLILPRLKRLAKQGIGICIDDFGVGYSSLSYLQTLPINTIKVDRSFLSCINEESSKSSIINAIVAMANELELEVIIEGVETQLHLDYVKDIGCSVVQGFLMGRPEPVHKIDQLLKQ